MAQLLFWRSPLGAMLFGILLAYAFWFFDAKWWSLSLSVVFVILMAYNAFSPTMQQKRAQAPVTLDSFLYTPGWFLITAICWFLTSIGILVDESRSSEPAVSARATAATVAAPQFAADTSVSPALLASYPLVIARPITKARVDSRNYAVPEDTAGRFSGRSAWRGDELAGVGISTTEPIGFEAQGWLKAEKPGNYALGFEVAPAPGRQASCIAYGTLGGKEILKYHIAPTTTGRLFGRADLEPGLYRISLWVACIAKGDEQLQEYSIIIGHPDESGLQPIGGDDIVHKG